MLNLSDFIRFRLKLAHKFILLTSLLLLISFSCLGFYFISYQRELLYADIYELAETLAGNLAANAAFGLITYDSEQLQTLLQSLGKCRDIVYAWIEDEKGRKISEYSNMKWKEATGAVWNDKYLFHWNG
jgi:uncharacterized membrane protein affecting hemolysin expression